MKVQDWIFSVRYGALSYDRHAVVGPARAVTVESALGLAKVPEDVRTQIRGCAVVQDFIDGRLDPDRSGYYTSGRSGDDDSVAWTICIGSVHEVLRD